jgi:hypothetical protein
MKPNFLIIGAQKSGTESMIHHLNLYNDIYVHPKELHFFDSSNTSDIKKYNNNFSNTKKKIIGEKTPSYMYLRFAIDKIHKYNPNIKLIILLREPIQRCYSQYNMEIQRKTFNGSFMNFINLQKNIKLDKIKKNGFYPLQRGFYIDQIEYILTKFKRENIYIGISEEFKNNISKYNEVVNFLNSNKNAKNKIIFNPNIHKRQYNTPMSKKDFNYLYSIYKPYNDKLYKFLGEKIDSWDSYYTKLL